ncbi:MAG: hypothetical protein AAF989_15495 [Planctomycetota bacterium]
MKAERIAIGGWAITTTTPDSLLFQTLQNTTLSIAVDPFVKGHGGQL